MRFPVDIPPLPDRAKLPGASIRRGGPVRTALRSGEEAAPFVADQSYGLERPAQPREPATAAPPAPPAEAGGEERRRSERRAARAKVMLDTRTQARDRRRSGQRPIDIEI